MEKSKLKLNLKAKVTDRQKKPGQNSLLGITKKKLSGYWKRYYTALKAKRKKAVVVMLAISLVLILIVTSCSMLVIYLIKQKSDLQDHLSETVDLSDLDDFPESYAEITYSTDEPSEEPVISIGEIRANMPKRITLSDTSIDGFIQNVGIDQNNEIAVPNNVHLAGWYVHSAKPGQKGLSIIDGHLNGSSKGGVFANLDKVKPEQVFEVEYGDGRKVKFKVLEVKTVSVEEAGKLLFSKRKEVESQLNLITCGGQYDRSIRRYQDRVIVVSEKIN